MKTETLVTPLSRIFMGSIFVMAGISKFREPEKTNQYMASKNIPAVNVLRPLAATAEVVGGLSVLLGMGERVGAMALASFLVPTTIVFHDFWNESGQAKEMQQINFLKNLAIVGGLLHLGAHSHAKARSGPVWVPEEQDVNLLKAS